MNYAAIAWALFAFIAGAVLGGLTVYRLAGAGTVSPAPRRGFEWARRDVDIAAPTASNIAVRRIVDWTSAEADGKTLTFHLTGRDGLERDVTFTARQLWKFYRCDGPTRDQYSGDHGDYSKLLAVGKHYAWLTSDDGRRWSWAPALGTRERRLRALEMMADAQH